MERFEGLLRFEAHLERLNAVENIDSIKQLNLEWKSLKHAFEKSLIALEAEKRSLRAVLEANKKHIANLSITGVTAEDLKDSNRAVASLQQPSVLTDISVEPSVVEDAQIQNSLANDGVELVTSAQQPDTSSRDQKTNGVAPPRDSHEEVVGGDYQKVEYPVLYYHRPSGYYYDPTKQCYLMPVGPDGNRIEPEHSSAGGPSVSTDAKKVDIAAMLAEASDKVSERCGFTFDEKTGMYYDKSSRLYYDQNSSLYYNPEIGAYYVLDPVTQQYHLHSIVKMPEKKKEDEVIIELITEEELEELEKEDALEEGELPHSKRPRLPKGRPPPEEDWAPCIRLVVLESEKMAVGSLHIVTQKGAKIGREVSGSRGILLPEIQVSKEHLDIKYDRRRGGFVAIDRGSRNGTFLNENRLSKPKHDSDPTPLNHGDKLRLGNTLFGVHIHSGRETCDECNPELTSCNDTCDSNEPLDVQRRKELNRIKKLYGLRMKDTLDTLAGSDDGAQLLPDQYTDRAFQRRVTVGSVPPDSHIADDIPSSVHRPISGDNLGRVMLEKMGWKAGEGLGKSSAGITEPVLADVHEERTGLGSTYSKRNIGVEPSSSKEKHRRMQKHLEAVLEREQTTKQATKDDSGE